MRSLPALLCVVAIGCGHRSKLDPDVGADADQLWSLAPDDTQIGVIATPDGVSHAMHMFEAARELVALPDFALARPQLERVATAVFGAPNAGPDAIGLAPNLPLAVFVTSDSAIAILPVADRDKLLAAKHGEHGANGDKLGGTVCRELRGYYACASKPELFDRIGKGGLAKHLANARARGNVELFVARFFLAGSTPGPMVIVATLGSGELSLWGHWTGKPEGVWASFVHKSAPHPSTAGVSGFASADISPFFTGAPPAPIAGGVTLAQLATSLDGAVTATIPAGRVDVQIAAPLADPAPARTLVEHCSELGAVLELAKTQQPGACRFSMHAATELELDAWVDGNVLRLGKTKGATPGGQPAALTALGRELAAGDFTAVLWGRGTMLNVDGVTPATTELDSQAALVLHLLALVNELGIGIRVEPDGVTFQAAARTPWANPPELAAKVLAVPASVIIKGQREAGAALAASAPGSPFAADYKAGQGGLILPAMVVGMATSFVLPLLTRALGAPDPSKKRVDPAELTKFLARAFAEQAYESWRTDHPGTPCPKMEELIEYVPPLGPDVPRDRDLWGHPFTVVCGKDLPPGVTGIGIVSPGPDGKPGTADDIHSW